MAAHFEFLLRQLPYLLFGYPGQRPGGLILSVLLAVLGVGLGLLVAIGLGSASQSRFRSLRWLTRLYIEIFRGLPLILLLLINYQVVGGGRFGLELSPWWAALISLTLFSSAYQAEIVRAGLQAVPRQLEDSARVIGSTPWQVYRQVKLRYAFRVMMPAFAGQAISLFKDTSVVVVIGVSDLMTVARSALGSDLTNSSYWVSLYIFVGVLYFVVAFGIAQIAERWERRLPSKDLVHSLANY